MARAATRHAVLTLLSAAALFIQCATFSGWPSGGSEVTSLEAAAPAIAPPRAGFTPIKVVLLEFRNSARIGEFDVIPDGDYESQILKPVVPRVEPATTSDPTTPSPTVTSPTNTTTDAAAPVDHAPSAAGNETTSPATVTPPAGTTTASPPTEVVPEPTSEPTNLDVGALAREVTETALFQSGRFEVVPDFIFRQKVAAARAAGLDEAAATQAAAQELGIQYIFFGALTDFEIRQERQLWKLPLWVILLAASFAIKDDDLREFVWEAMIRIALAVPLNSEFWDYGLSYEDMDLDVDVAMDLRMVDARTGAVAYSDDKTVTRTENMRNLDLLVWATNRRLKITKSGAGRQIRYVATELVRDLAEYVDAANVPAPAKAEVVP